MALSSKKVAVLGGTGALGSGLAKRLARAGIQVIIGSRDAAKAADVASSLATESGGPISGATYRDAAAAADIILLTVPYASQLEVIEAAAPELTGKILIDATVPLVPPKVSVVQLPPEGCAAQRAQTAVGADVRVVSAFQNVGAQWLHQDGEIDCDVLVNGNDPDACAQVVELVRACGLRGWHTGTLANAAAAEALTSLLIFLNRTHKTGHAGIRITGIGTGLD